MSNAGAAGVGAHGRRGCWPAGRTRRWPLGVPGIGRSADCKAWCIACILSRSIRDIQQWTMLAHSRPHHATACSACRTTMIVLPNVITNVHNIDAVSPQRRSSRRWRIAVPAGALCLWRGRDRPPARAAAETQPAAQDRLRRGGPAARAAAGLHQVPHPCMCTAVSCAQPKLAARAKP